MWNHPSQACNTSFPQFSTANQKLCIIQIRCVIWISSTNNCCFITHLFPITKKLIQRFESWPWRPQHRMLNISLLRNYPSLWILESTDCRTKLKGNHSLIPPPHSTIHYYPGPNLPFHISSHLLHNCLLKVHVTKMPFYLPHLKGLWYIQWRVLDLNGERFVSHRTPNPPSSLCG